MLINLTCQFFKHIKTVTIYFNYKFRRTFSNPYFVAFVVIIVLEPFVNIIKLKSPISLKVFEGIAQLIKLAQENI